MASLLGSRILRNDGVAGVIVSATPDSMWRAGQACVYDIVWEDKTYARKVMPEAISKSGWSLQSGKVDPVECNRIWSEFQVERARQMAARFTAVSTSRTPDRPIEVNRHKRMHAQVAEPPIEMGPVVRPASWHARQMLGVAMPGVSFAVSMERRKLTVGWLDGPVESRVNQAVAALQDRGLAEKVVVRRGAQIHFIHAAIEHVVARVWGDLLKPGARADLLRLTPTDFQAHQQGSVMTPPVCPLGATPYSSLIRCVIDRWDDELGEFLDTERTRYLTQERGFLFPAGDAKESIAFAERMRGARARFEEAREFAGSLGQVERARG